MTEYTREDLVQIALMAGVFDHMEKIKCHGYVVHWQPEPVGAPVPDEQLFDPSGVLPPCNQIVFYLQAQPFGGNTYAALTCGNHVIAGPLPWTGWSTLSDLKGSVQ